MKKSPWVSQVGLKAITNVLMREAQRDHTHRGETTWRQSRDQTDVASHKPAHAAATGSQKKQEVFSPGALS